MPYKVDIHKAFTTMSWKFLLLVLTRFDFHQSFVSWISTNGSLVAFFPYSKGVRQGVSLSPLLFCLAVEVLSRGISKFMNDKKILHMTSS